jgi:hypothetical protein
MEEGPAAMEAVGSTKSALLQLCTRPLRLMRPHTPASYGHITELIRSMLKRYVQTPGFGQGDLGANPNL